MTDTAHLRALLSAATARPWRCFDSVYGNDVIAIMKGDKPSDGSCWKEIVAWTGFDGSDVPKRYRRANQELIVAAVNSLAPLLDQLDAQAAEIERANVAMQGIAEATFDVDFATERRITELTRENRQAQAEIERLREALTKQNDEISQKLGKALGYPWYRDDQENFPGATEVNGVCVGEHVAETLAIEAADSISRQSEALAELDRENRRLREANAELRERARSVWTSAEQMRDRCAAVLSKDVVALSRELGLPPRPPESPATWQLRVYRAAIRNLPIGEQG